MASTKKKQDDKQLTMLREIVALQNNKYCFDCHQRGPTYINMTIGSFVCTACSGLLRGLNPPHRVKSISMGSFTTDEIEFIKCHGNEYCRKVWLKKYNEQLNNQIESRDESKVRDFMMQKYEKKSYYVAPLESMKEEAKQTNDTLINKVTATKPLKSLLGENVPKLQVGNTEKTQFPASFNQVSSAPQSPGSQSTQSPKSVGSTGVGDLFGGIGNDPFASSAPQTHSAAAGGFADFGKFNSITSSQPAVFAQRTPLQPVGSSKKVLNGPTNAVAVPAAAPLYGTGGDKYSNLSELFSLNNAAVHDTTSPAGWNSVFNTPTQNTTWNSTSSSTSGINWGGDSHTTGGLDWNSSSSPQMASGSAGGLNWGGSSVASSTTSWGSAPQSTSVANPFKDSSNQLLTAQPILGMAGASRVPSMNPFVAQPGVNAIGYGAANPQTNIITGFGGQNMLVGAPAAVFGQPHQQSGGYGAVYGAQPVQVLGQMGQPVSYVGQMQGYGVPLQVWGQVPVGTAAPNPFMSPYQQYSSPKTGSSNPFL